MSVNWYVYIIKSTDNKFYTGITTDVIRRWQEHSGTIKLTGKAKGAKFFRGRKPQSLVYVVGCNSRSMASKQEAAIKQLSRSEKVILISSSENQLEQHEQLIHLRNKND